VLADGVHAHLPGRRSIVLGVPTDDHRAGHRPQYPRRRRSPSSRAVVAAPSARLLDADEPWAPRDWSGLGTELAVAPLDDGALLVGRPALRWLPAELMRLRHLAGVAASVTAPSAENVI